MLFRSIGAAATDPVLPALLKPLLDGGFGASRQGSLPPFAFALVVVAVFVLRGVLSFVSSYLMAWVGNRVVL